MSLPNDVQDNSQRYTSAAASVAMAAVDCKNVGIPRSRSRYAETRDSPMKRVSNSAITMWLILMILVVFHSPGSNANAVSSSEMDLQHRLVGSWKAVSFTDIPDRGENVYPFGTAPTGLMIYTADGYFSASVIAGPISVVPKDTSAMSVDELRALSHEFLSWFGTYRTKDSQTIVFHIDGSSWPSYDGTEQTRKCRLEQDSLVFYGNYTKNQQHYHYEHVFRRL
jgi:hypothetical protein